MVPYFLAQIKNKSLQSGSGWPAESDDLLFLLRSRGWPSDDLFFVLKFNLGCIVVKIYLNSKIKTNL